MERIFIMSSSDLIGIIVLLVLMYLVKRNHFIGKMKSSQFSILICLTIAILILEIMSNMLDMYASKDLRTFAFVVNIAGFSVMFILPVMFGVLYSDRVAKYKYQLLIPAFVGSILCISSVYFKWIFWINEDGYYLRGNLFMVSFIIQVFGFCVLLYAHFDLIKQYDNWEKKFLWIIYAVILGTSLTQVVFPKIEVMWGGIASAELLYYIFLRELQFCYDPVTKIKNRNVFSEELKSIIPDGKTFLISFDINNLKVINDKLGHLAGDKLLLQSANIIKESYKECGELYRNGGDEFVMIAKNCSNETILQAREKLMEMIETLRLTYGDIFYIANGYSLYDSNVHKSQKECLRESDMKMYKDKIASKK